MFAGIGQNDNNNNNNDETRQNEYITKTRYHQAEYSKLDHCTDELRQLIIIRHELLNRQIKASLLVEKINLLEPAMNQFAQLLNVVYHTASSPDIEPKKRQLTEEIVQHSIIIEWPKKIPDIWNPVNGSDIIESEIDQPPLIHRARSVVKCRTSHPTMRIRVCSLTKPEELGKKHVPVLHEAFFRATLVKLPSDAHECQVAGKLILTQREGTPATKCSDQNGAIVNNRGQIIVSQTASDKYPSLLRDQYNEVGKTTPFKYAHGTLCATFPEIGVTLNSMVDRRQLATRYAIQVEVAIKLDTMIIRRTVLSHPFLIAITNDQTEPLLSSIFWQRLLNYDQFPEPSSHLQGESSTKIEPPVPWKTVRESLKYFVKAQCPPARALYDDELLHLQCMLFLTRAIKRKQDEDEDEEIEKKLFGNVRPNKGGLTGIQKIRHRLLRENVLGDVLVEKYELMHARCYSISDCSTELGHSVWQFIYKANEMILDVGRKICPMPLPNDNKKGSKSKKLMALTDDCQTMLNLFNSRMITFLGVKDVIKLFNTLRGEDKKQGTITKAIMIRFCDENAGHLSFAFTAPESHEGSPLMGSLSSEQIKDFKQGLPEVLFDESFPKKYEQIAKSEFDRQSGVPARLIVTVPKKTSIFPHFETLRVPNDCIRTSDEESIRINVLTGERLNNDVNIQNDAVNNAILMALQFQDIAVKLPFSNPVLFNFLNYSNESNKNNGNIGYSSLTSNPLKRPAPVDEEINTKDDSGSVIQDNTSEAEEPLNLVSKRRPPLDQTPSTIERPSVVYYANLWTPNKN